MIVKLIEFDGEKLPIKIWAERFGLPPKTIAGRLNRGWSIEKAFKTPNKRYIIAFGEAKSSQQWTKDSRCCVKSSVTLNDRLRNSGLSPEECITTPVQEFRPTDFTEKVYGDIKILNAFKDAKKYFADCLCLKCQRTFRAPLSGIVREEYKSCGCSRYSSGRGNRGWRGHEDISHTRFSRVKGRARRDKIFFDITIEYMWEIFIGQKKRCALTGVDLSLSTTADINNGTASLDRIDSSKGYVKGNVQWVHKDINRMKLDHSLEKFIEWCKKVASWDDAQGGLVFNPALPKPKVIHEP